LVGHSIMCPSRQYLWQKIRQSKGLCIECGKPSVNARYCLKHAIKTRERQRIRKGAIRRNNTELTKLESDNPGCI
jgi:hypothetical protein